MFHVAKSSADSKVVWMGKILQCYKTALAALQSHISVSQIRLILGCNMCISMLLYLFSDLEGQIKDLYSDHYRERIRQEHKICSNRQYPLPSTHRSAAARKAQADFQAMYRRGVTTSHKILICIVLLGFLSGFCIILGMLYAAFKVLINCIYFLMSVLDYVLPGMALHDILFMFWKGSGWFKIVCVIFMHLISVVNFEWFCYLACILYEACVFADQFIQSQNFHNWYIPF
jgi:hypothetical protein